MSRNLAEVNTALCEALGLDPKRIAKITVTMEAGRVPIAVVERFVIDAADVTALCDEWRELKPVPRLQVETYDLLPQDVTDA